MITEAIILAGGKGTRLQSVVKDIPKPMADINGKPFLSYILDKLSKQGITKAYLAVGYKKEVIEQYYSSFYANMAIQYVHEAKPLGTGGAIKQALTHTKTNNVLIVNGDTFFDVDINAFAKFHIQEKATISLALKPLTDFERYGTVLLDDDNIIKQFIEKQYQLKGNINGGLYLVNKQAVNLNYYPEVFSFEVDFLEQSTQVYLQKGFISDSYFIDIGIPNDYAQAQLDFAKQNIKNLIVDSSWTLFLDRDGVINKKRDNDYVKSVAEFEFIEGAIEAIDTLSHLFYKTIVVTNQQCVGKNIITANELDYIHDNMLANTSGIGKVYYAPQLVSENSIMRKPNTGMADKAKIDFPEIDFTKAIMVGDSPSDIEFGIRKGMTTVFIGNKNNQADFTFNSLLAFSHFIQNK